MQLGHQAALFEFGDLMIDCLVIRKIFPDSESHLQIAFVFEYFCLQNASFVFVAEYVAQDVLVKDDDGSVFFFRMEILNNFLKWDELFIAHIFPF